MSTLPRGSVLASSGERLCIGHLPGLSWLSHPHGEQSPGGQPAWLSGKGPQPGYLATSLLSQALLWSPSLHHLISAPSTHVEWAGPGLLAKCGGKGHVIGGGKAWVPARATPPLRAVSCLGHRRVMSERPCGHSSGLNSPSKNSEVEEWDHPYLTDEEAEAQLLAAPPRSLHLQFRSLPTLPERSR